MTEEDKVTAAGLGTALPAEEKPEAAALAETTFANAVRIFQLEG